jgi:hypothetical protein
MKIFQLATIVCLGALAAVQAKPIQFDFETPDSLDASRVRAYWFPRTAKEKRSPLHVADLRRSSSKPIAGTWSAKLSFTLDGKPYPAAGMGLMFPEAAMVDLQSLTSIALKLRTDKKRSLRVSIASHAIGYESANDTGVGLGADIVSQDTLTSWTIRSERLSFPRWAGEVPALTSAEILAQTFAIQITTSCDSTNCNHDSGWIQVDDVILNGVDDAAKEPAPGNCTGEGLLLSDFATTPTKRNVLGGWWYAYTDSSSPDTSAHGSSLVRDTSGNWSASGWAPDPKTHKANADFWLQRQNTYSGYAALETQMGSQLQPMSFPGLHSISFRLDMRAGFPDTVPFVLFHAKKAAVEFQKGRDHQVKLPYHSGARTWCIDLDSLQQPDWVGLWKEPFTSDSLLALSWEVRLASMYRSGQVSIALDSIKLYGWNPTAIHGKARTTPQLHMKRSADRLYLQRSNTSPARVRILLPDGKCVREETWGTGESQLSIPLRGGFHLLQIVDDKRHSTIQAIPAL